MCLLIQRGNAIHILYVEWSSTKRQIASSLSQSQMHGEKEQHPRIEQEVIKGLDSKMILP